MSQIKRWIAGLTVAAGIGLLAVAPAVAQDAGPGAGAASGANAGEMFLGPADAPVTVVEYASLTCPHCAHFHEEIWPALKSQYIDTGKVRFVYRDFPLDEAALRGAQLARCKGDTDSFFGFIDILFKQQRAWATQNWGENLAQIARFGGIGNEQFRACMNDQALVDSIVKSRVDGNQKYNITGTPTVIVNERNIGSPQNFEAIKAAIEAALPSGAVAPSATPAGTAPAPTGIWARIKAWFGS